MHVAVVPDRAAAAGAVVLREPPTVRSARPCLDGLTLLIRRLGRCPEARRAYDNGTYLARGNRPARRPPVQRIPWTGRRGDAVSHHPVGPGPPGPARSVMGRAPCRTAGAFIRHYASMGEPWLGVEAMDCRSMSVMMTSWKAWVVVAYWGVDPS